MTQTYTSYHILSLCLDGVIDQLKKNGPGASCWNVLEPALNFWDSRPGRSSSWLRSFSIWVEISGESGNSYFLKTINTPTGCPLAGLSKAAPHPQIRFSSSSSKDPVTFYLMLHKLGEFSPTSAYILHIQSYPYIYIYRYPMYPMVI